MSKPKTLLIITPGFPADEGDSTCMPPQQLFVKAMQQQHKELDIIILTLQYPFKAGNYSWHGIRVIAFGGRNRGGILRILNWLDVWMLLRQLKKQYNIIGVLSFWLGECGLISHRFAKKYKLPHYCWLLGQDARPGNKYVKLIKPKGDSLIALSDALAAEFYANYGILPGRVIPPGIDATSFGEPVLHRDIDLMGAGSLIALKQYDVFIEVVKTVSLKFPRVNAVICGNGPEIGNLRRLISQAGLDENITLMGELSHSEVLGLMQRSKVFLHTSAYEGFGMVLSEALYAGAQVVSFTQPMNEMPGQFHKAGGKGDMIAMVSALLNDDSLGHEVVLQFPVDVVAERVVGLFV